MATRAVYTFCDERKCYSIYKHWNNDPGNAIVLLEKAAKLAWPLPRFEAEEFAAAFVAANKKV